MSDDHKHALRAQAAWRGKYRARSHDAAHAEVDLPEVPASKNIRVPAGKPAIVADQAGLSDLLKHLHEKKVFAFDSEFIGEMSYVPKLCLLQVATDERIALIDPLAELDLRGFWQLMLDASVRKIVHAGHQDVEPVLRLLGQPAQNVVDTQIAAGFIGLCFPCSLLRLVQELLGVRLHKGLTFTDWTQRPLSQQQVYYAADDVRYLPALWHEIEQRFPSPATLGWLEEECAAMCRLPLYTFDPQTTYLRVRGAGTLRAAQLGMLRELVAWRDAAAQHADLPPRALVKDEVLVDLCRHPVKSAEKLAGVRNLPRPVAAQYAREILDALEIGAENPVENSPFPPRSEESPRQQFEVDAANALLQTLCHARGIDPAMVASRSDVADFVAAMHKPAMLERLPLYNSWRRQVAGEPLRQMLLEAKPANFCWGKDGLRSVE